MSSNEIKAANTSFSKRSFSDRILLNLVEIDIWYIISAVLSFPPFDWLPTQEGLVGCCLVTERDKFR